MADIENALVRIYDKKGKEIIGAGFLATCSQIITCAHVIINALGLPNDHKELPTESIFLDFPLLESPSTQISAVVKMWCPDPTQDVALLELLSDPPRGSQPIPLVGGGDYTSHFRVCGFTEALPEGDWVNGTMLGRTGDRYIHVESSTNRRITQGFSGGPVWDRDANRLAGIVVASFEGEPDDKVAYLIPVESILEMLFPGHKLEPQPNKSLRYACYISFPTPADDFLLEIAQDLKTRLKRELDISITDNLIYMNSDRTYNDQKAAIALCESACMVMLFTQRYFDAKHPFCTREFRAMQILEEVRLQALGVNISKKHCLIVPVIIRGSIDDLPSCIRKHSVYDFKRAYALDVSPRNRDKNFRLSIEELAEHVANHWYLLQNRIQNPCGNCPDFSFPRESEILSMLTNWKPHGIFEELS